MRTQVVGVKDFRQNISAFAKKAKNENISFLVTFRNQPYFEVRPCYNEKVDLDDVQVDYYKTIEQGLGFWNSMEDDNIFKD